MQEDSHQFNQTYIETIKKFLEAENKCFEKVGALNKEFESEATRLTNSHHSNLQDLQKKKDIEISGLQNRILGLANKVKDLVALAKQSEEGATNYLSKFSYLKNILPAVKSEQSFEGDLKKDNSLDALMATISELAHTIAEDEKTVKGAVYKLLLFRKKRSKGKTITFATAPVAVILAIFAVSMFNMHLLYNGYKRANLALDQNNWGLVNEEIEELKIARGFRRLIVPIFFGESSYNRILKTFGINESNIKEVEFTLLQREGYFNLGMAAFNSQKWAEAVHNFDIIRNVIDKQHLSPSQTFYKYEFEINEYQKKRNLNESFNDIARLLKDCEHYASHDSLKK